MSERWRLINGAQLYDLQADREQRHDRAAQYPLVVAALRAAYEEWWAIVSQQAARNVPIAIGGENGGTTLSAHDWRNEASDCPWHQGQIRAGQRSEGYWEVRVLRAGRYRFRLRRWPEDAGHALSAGIEGDDIAWWPDWIAEEWHHWYRGGAALPIDRAELEIRAESATRSGRPPPLLRGSRRRQATLPGATEATFHLHLPPGDYRLFTRFQGENLRLGAYYVRVEWGDR